MAPARSLTEGAKAGRRVRILSLVCIAAALIVGLWALPMTRGLAQAAPQGWAICNETSFIVEAATGRPEGRAVLVQGWLRLRPGECRIAAAAPLTKGVHYVFARTSNAHRGGRRQWAGVAHLCVDPQNAFTIENPPSCSAMGLEDRMFREVRINKKESWRTSFAEAENYSLSRARAAGIMRLLADAGYDTRAPDGGADPRRMSAAIARYRADSGGRPVSEEQLIDQLESVARKRAEAVGLSLCNRTNGRIWAAIARRRGEGWESRGWWQLGPGGCARTIDDPLLQGVYFVYGVLDNPQGERLLAAGGEEFCVSEAKFAILGREQCEPRFYDTALFTPISPQGREGMVVEFFDRDFLQPGVQPRHTKMPRMADVPGTVGLGISHGLAPASAKAAPTRSRRAAKEDQDLPSGGTGDE